jgi:hypothetical protein
MANQEQAVDVLVNYYEALCVGEVSGISKYFDDTVTLISLTGSNAVSGVTNIEAAFQTLLDTWKKLGVSWKFKYETNKFQIEEIQKNVITIRTPLTNFKETGEVFESWNCMYVFVDTADGWKISLATFDDKGTESFAEAQ